MNLSYRNEELSQEVILLLQDIIKDNGTLLLWQAHAKAQAQKAVATSYEATKKTLQLNLTHRPEGLDSSRPIYCKGDHKNIVFKSHQFECTSTVVKLIVPNDIRLQELRKSKRFEVYTNKKAYLTVSIPSHYESKESSFIFKLQEISEKGCSVFMHSSSLKNFHVGDKLKLTAIGSDTVNFPFKAEIKYITPVSQRGQTEVQLYKVGMCFEEALNFYNYYLTRHLNY